METQVVLNTTVDVTLVLELMAFAMRARDFATKKGDAVKVVAMLKYVVMASPHLQNIFKTLLDQTHTERAG